MVGGAQTGRAWQCGATGEIQRQQGIDIGGVGGREALYLDDGEVPVLGACSAYVAMARGGAADIPGQGVDVGLYSGRGVEAVEVVAAGVVDEVWLGRADEVSELIVAGRGQSSGWARGRGWRAAYAIGILRG